MSKEFQIPEHYGNKISTVDKEGKRKWIYAFQPKGKLYTYRKWLSYFYYALFFALPFIKINGNPALMFNMSKGEFSIFGQLFFPQDFMILGFGMVIAIVFVIVFTLQFGRVFCGWFCPQTIFLEMLYRRVEFLIEGQAHIQMKMAVKKDKPKSFYVKRVIKHIVFYILSALIAHTFFAYIVGVEGVVELYQSPFSEHWLTWLALFIFTTIFYAVYAYIREIVCTVICPYGRMQSVLMDKKSVAVAYDYNRGEPRSKKRKKVPATLNMEMLEEDIQGDCIDCGMCVNVCPTGIDIRDGLQMECVNCTACIDACDDMMIKVGKPTKLITFASEEQLENNTVGKFQWNLRAKVSIVLLVLLSTVFIGMIAYRPIFDSTLLRVPGQLYQEHNNETTTNLYKILITSKSNKTLPVALKIDYPKSNIEFIDKKPDSIQAAGHTQYTFFVRIKNSELHNRKTNIQIQILSDDKVIQTKSVSFLSGY